jgi:hypothetical protein
MIDADGRVKTVYVEDSEETRELIGWSRTLTDSTLAEVPSAIMMLLRAGLLEIEYTTDRIRPTIWYYRPCRRL